MKLITMKNRNLLDLSIVLIISVIFALFSISINFIDKLCSFFDAYIGHPIAEFFINVVFLWLAGLIWVTYRRWRKAAKEQTELDNIISSIGPDVLVVIDSDRNIIMCNASVERMFGYQVDEVINQKIDFLYSNRRSEPEHRHDTFEILKKDGFHIGLVTGKKKNGEIIPLEIITGTLSGRGGAVLLLRDITERKRAEETIKHLAYYDSLTDLPNRMLFNDRLTQALAHAHRNKQKLALVLLDLDGFKDINDTLGHSMGDKLLQAVGHRLTGLLRKGDTVARMGGDEFMLSLPEIARVEDAAKIAQKILEAFKKPFLLDNHKLHITTSIGIAIYPKDGEDVNTLMNNADNALYRAKQQGRNNYQRYTPAT